jgi:hypothetical protein
MGTSRAAAWTCPVSRDEAAQVESLHQRCQAGDVPSCQGFTAIAEKGLYEWMKPSFDRNQ